MKKALSWIVVCSIALYILSVIVLPFAGLIELIPYFVVVALIVGIISAVGIIVLLIKERIKDKEDEKDDLGKY